MHSTQTASLRLFQEVNAIQDYAVGSEAKSSIVGYEALSIVEDADRENPPAGSGRESSDQPGKPSSWRWVEYRADE